MFEVTSSVYYNEKRNFESGKVESEDNGKVKALETLVLSADTTTELAQKGVESYGVTMMDVVTNKVSVKLNGSSVVIKRYEMADGEVAGDVQLGEWQGGKIDVYLGCYKHDIQIVERADVSFDNVFAVNE